MNTTARHESTGEGSKIHISEQFARELVKFGKRDWAIPREDKVQAKGKGTLTTFWLQIKGDKASTVLSSAKGQPRPSAVSRPSLEEMMSTRFAASQTGGPHPKLSPIPDVRDSTTSHSEAIVDTLLGQRVSTFPAQLPTASEFPTESELGGDSMDDERVRHTVNLLGFEKFDDEISL